jgi:hypothetical protein
MWRASAVAVLILIAGCERKHPSFLARVSEDCAAGDQWACDLLESLARHSP